MNTLILPPQLSVKVNKEHKVFKSSSETFTACSLLSQSLPHQHREAINYISGLTQRPSRTDTHFLRSCQPAHTRCQPAHTSLPPRSPRSLPGLGPTSPAGAGAAAAAEQQQQQRRRSSCSSCSSCSSSTQLHVRSWFLLKLLKVSPAGQRPPPSANTHTHRHTGAAAGCKCWS